MKRELKFRAWDGEKMIDDVLPFRWDFVLTNMLSRCVESTGSGILGSGGKTATFEIPGYAYKEIMQYTGFKDKKGVEVYDGDIIRYALMEGLGMPKRRGLTRIIKTDHLGSIGWFDTDVEVIGNRYENPELLIDFELS